jgi:hypothetical protein
VLAIAGYDAPPSDVVEPFIQTLHEKGILPVDKSLKLLSDKSRAGLSAAGKI